MQSEPHLKLVSALENREELVPLYEEYADLLLKTDPVFAKSLVQQNYDEEIEHLEEKYGEPAGRLYLAEWEGGTAGCVALHPLGCGLAELKRLYVRPAFRGHGIGRALTEQIIADARAEGYHTLQLDTQPFLPEAIRLYRKLGFAEMKGYNPSPLPETIYMKLEL